MARAHADEPHRLEPKWSHTHRVTVDAGSLVARAMGTETVGGQVLDSSLAFATSMDGFNKLGWHWWPSEIAIATREHEGRAPCINLGTCKVGCAQGAKGTVDVTYWPLALRAGVKLKTRCRVREILVDDNDMATGVVYYDAEGREQALVRRNKAGVVASVARRQGGEVQAQPAHARVLLGRLAAIEQEAGGQPARHDALELIERVRNAAVRNPEAGWRPKLQSIAMAMINGENTMASNMAPTISDSRFAPSRTDAFSDASAPVDTALSNGSASTTAVSANVVSKSASAIRFFLNSNIAARPIQNAC